MLTAIVGTNWGDEGKGRMVDLLSENYDIICRYQGGNNAGHTVINDKGKFILNLLPSGILRETTVNVMGGGMVVDIEHLAGEMSRLQEKGVKVTPNNLKISKSAVICMPYHKLQDCLEEERLADKKFGSTRRGIAPVYADKYMKKSIRMCDLFLPIDMLTEKVKNIVEWKNLTIANGYKAEAIDYKDIMAWLEKYGDPIKSFIVDTTEFLNNAAQNGKNIMFEAQLGALRDLDFGIYPYTSSSQTIAAYATTGSGVPNLRLDSTIGIMKAYSSCVGEGPFVCEMFGAEAESLREAGGEYGAATGRPRRVGGFDVVASRYGAQVQGATTIALTKLDVLSGMDKIPVCVAYEYQGKRITTFGTSEEQEQSKPIIEYMDGFKEDITGCRKFSDLPINAQKYIKFIEESVGVPMGYISVGAEREQIIEME
ncbi:MAG: adenylosuccinate synthase [Clostridiales bacterium]|jgi:adenylosuccinate synthase|nr:adenylosuccinate synthase [Clostridiales bacterium]